MPLGSIHCMMQLEVPAAAGKKQAHSFVGIGCKSMYLFSLFVPGIIHHVETEWIIHFTDRRGIQRESIPLALGFQ